MYTFRAFAALASGCLLTGLLGACTPAPYASSHPGPASEYRITTAEMSRLTGATAWDVLRQSGVPLSVVPTSQGVSTRLSRRGPGSILLNEDPIVVVDNVRTIGLELLHQISSRDIEEIRVLTGLEATTRYGAGASGGAIVISTITPG